jgi:hypothetical protein
MISFLTKNCGGKIHKTLGLKILRFLRLKVDFEADIPYIFSMNNSFL